MIQKIFDIYAINAAEEVNENFGKIDNSEFYNVSQGYGSFSLDGTSIGTTQLKTCLGIAVFCEVKQLTAPNNVVYGTYIHHFDGVEGFGKVDFEKREIIIPNAIIFASKIVNFLTEELTLNNLELINILNVAMIGGSEEKVTSNIVEGFEILKNSVIINKASEVINFYKFIENNIQANEDNRNDIIKKILQNKVIANDVSNVITIFNDNKTIRDLNLIDNFIRKVDIFLAPSNGKIINDDPTGESRIVALNKDTKHERTIIFELYFKDRAIACYSIDLANKKVREEIYIDNINATDFNNNVNNLEECINRFKNICDKLLAVNFEVVRDTGNLKYLYDFIADFNKKNTENLLLPPSSTNNIYFNNSNRSRIGQETEHNENIQQSQDNPSSSNNSI